MKGTTVNMMLWNVLSMTKATPSASVRRVRERAEIPCVDSSGTRVKPSPIYVDSSGGPVYSTTRSNSFPKDHVLVQIH